MVKHLKNEQSNWKPKNKTSWSLKVLKLEENRELETIEGLFPKKIKNNEIKNELDEIKEWEKKSNEMT